MNNILDKTKIQCSSCGMCSAVCPVGAITMTYKDGFYFPEVDNEKCISCGLCKKSCIKYNEVEISKDIKVYSAYVKDNEVLKKSSSGGIAYGLMKRAIEKGYKAIGCEFDLDKNIAVHSIADSVDDLDKYYGSKYMQSQFWLELRQVISSKDKYIVIGTPCQIYALRCVVERMKKLDNFIFVDFFCHGTPSKLIWDNVRAISEKKHGNLTGVGFRSKSTGWHNFVNELEFGQKSVVKDEGCFYDLFFSDAVLNKSCYTCDVRKSYKYADIRIGDFWGDKYATNATGVSLVCISSDRGQALFDAIKSEYVIKEEDISFEKYQAVRDYFECDGNLHDNMMNELVKKDNKKAYKLYYQSLSFKAKIKIKLKKIVNLLPKSLVGKIRKIYYKG